MKDFEKGIIKPFEKVSRGDSETETRDDSQEFLKVFHKHIKFE